MKVRLSSHRQEIAGLRLAATDLAKYSRDSRIDGTRILRTDGLQQVYGAGYSIGSDVGEVARLRGRRQNRGRVDGRTRLRLRFEIREEKELVLQRFLTGMPGKFEAAKGNPKMCAALISCDGATGRAHRIQRIMMGE